MKHLLTFTGNAVGLTRPYQYQVMHLETLGRVQLCYSDGRKWEVGHIVDIPASMTAGEVAQTMRRFILGEIDHAEYNQLLGKDR